MIFLFMLDAFYGWLADLDGKLSQRGGGDRRYLAWEAGLENNFKGPNVRHPALQLGLALAVSGTIGAFVAEAGVSPMTAVFWRCALGAVFLALWCLAFGYLPGRAISPRNLAYSAIAGGFLALCWVCLFAGFQLTSIATATIVFQSYPFLLVLAGIVFLREKATLDQFGWLVAAFAGVTLASGAVGLPAFDSGNWLLGVALTLAAAASYVVTTLAVRAIQGQRPEVTMLFQAIVGAVLVSFAADFSQSISLPAWGWLIGMGVIHSGLVMVAMYATYPLLPTPVIAIMNFIYPAVAILLDWLVYGHPLSPLQLSGVAIIVIATLGVNLNWRIFGERRQAP
jgi:drug/metabolite transporter (DMT)-like permease